MQKPSVASDPAEKPGDPHLLRGLGPGMATALVVGNVIGAGIFMKPGEAAAAAGTVPVALAAWLAGGVLSLLGALTLAEVALRLPQAGGLYVYLREAFGRPIAFLYGWSEFFFGMPASIGALAAGVVFQIGLLGGWSPGLWTGAAVAVLLVAVLAGINIAGIVWGGRTQVATTVIKCGFLAALAALPLVMMLCGQPGVKAANFGSTVTPVAGANAAFHVRFAGALLAVLWAYNGWHAVAPVAEEIRNPRRNIPLALLTGSVVLIALYFATVLAYHAALPMEAIRAAGILLPQAMAGALLAPAGTVAVQAATVVISLAAIVSMAGSLNACLMNGPRVGFAMARDSVLPDRLAAVHPRFHTPAAAIVVQAGMSAVLTLAAAWLVAQFDSFGERSVFDLLTAYVTFTASIFLTLAVATIFLLRRRGIGAASDGHGYRTPLYPWVPLAFVIGSSLFVASVFAGQPREALAGLALTLAGLPVYWWFTRR